jgi:hypothetical protein
MEMEKDKRQMTVYFNHGGRLVVDFPQAERSTAAMVVDEILKSNMLSIETTGKTMLIPMSSVKYVELTPALKGLVTGIRDARIIE